MDNRYNQASSSQASPRFHLPRPEISVDGSTSHVIHGRLRRVTSDGSSHSSENGIRRRLRPPSVRASASTSNVHGHAYLEAHSESRSGVPRSSTSETAATSTRSTFSPIALTLLGDGSDWDDAAAAHTQATSTNTENSTSAAAETSSTSSRTFISNLDERRLYANSPDRVPVTSNDTPSTTSESQLRRRGTMQIVGASARRTGSHLHPIIRNRRSHRVAHEESSPRLELAEQSMHSFKRSFEDATAASASSTLPLSDGTSPTQAGDESQRTPDLSLDISSSSSSDNEPAYLPFLEANLNRTSLDLSLPLSWYRDGDDRQDIGTSTSILRHSPPVLESPGIRVKRRRSRTSSDPSGTVFTGRFSDDHAGDTSIQQTDREAYSREYQVPSRTDEAGTSHPYAERLSVTHPGTLLSYSPPPVEFSPIREYARTPSPELPSGISLDYSPPPPEFSPIPEMDSYDDTADHWAAEFEEWVRSAGEDDDLRSLESGGSSSNLARYIDSIMAADSEEEVEDSHASDGEGHASPDYSLRGAAFWESSFHHEDDTTRTAADSPTSRQAPVSVRRGLARQFSLGPLPMFSVDDQTDDDDDNESDIHEPYTLGDILVEEDARALRSSNGQGSVSRGRLPRRPNLQRNATAVSPPEESPLNSPEEQMRTLPSGARQIARDWISLGPQTFLTGGASPVHMPGNWRALGSHFDTALPRLPPLNLDIPNDMDLLEETIDEEALSYRATDFTTHTSRLNIPDANNENDVRSRSTTGDTSSSETGWHSDVERAHAELLADHLEASRRITADVQNLQQARPSFAQHRSNVSSLPPPPPWLSTPRLPSLEPLRVGPSSAPPRVNFSAARGSTSRSINAISNRNTDGSRLWGEVDSNRSFLPSPSSMAAATTASVAVQSHLMRRPGALGRSNMRGPTRSSNEAWMRAQGIDFYDSLAPSSSYRPTTTQAHVQAQTTASQAATMDQYRDEERRWASVTRLSPSIRRTTPTPESSQPPSPTSAQIASWSPAVSPGTGPAMHTGSGHSQQVPTSGHRAYSHSGQSPAFAIHPVTLNRSRRTVSADQRLPNIASDTQHRGFRPLTLSHHTGEVSSPQLAAIRPVSPLFDASAAVQTVRPDGRQRQNTYASVFEEDVLEEDGNGDQDTPDVSSGHTETQDARRSRIPRHSFRSARSSSSTSHDISRRRSSQANSISDWFRWSRSDDPAELVPEQPAMSSTPSAPSPRLAAVEVGEAGEGIAAAMRRLDEVRRLLDEVQQNTDRRRRAYAARLDSPRDESLSASTPSGTDAGRLFPPSMETSRLQGNRLFSGAPRSGLWSSDLSTARGSTSVSTSQAEGPAAGAQRPSNYLPGLYSSVDARARLTARNQTATPTSPLLNRAPNGPEQHYRGSTFNEINARDTGTDRFNRPLPDRHTRHHGFNSFRTTFSETRSATTALNALPPDHRRSQGAQPDTGVSSLATSAAPHGPGFDPWASAISHTANLGTLPRYPPFLLRSLRDTTFAGSGIAADPRNYALESEIDTSFEGLTALAERVGNALHRGVNAAALATSMTVYAYAATAMQTGSPADDETEGEPQETRCAICLEDYEDDDQCARSNKCGHSLHEMCFKTWLRRNTSCPICRQDVV